MTMEHADWEVLTQLVDRHAAALVLYARQWCGVPEDVVQEAFTSLMRQRPAPANAVGWLYRAVRNGAISAARSAARRTCHEARAATRRESWFAPSEGDQLDAATVSEALGQLAPPLREVLVARLWGGLSFEEIGQLSGVSTSTAHRRYTEALGALRERFGVACPKTEA